LAGPRVDDPVVIYAAEGAPHNAPLYTWERGAGSRERGVIERNFLYWYASLKILVADAISPSGRARSFLLLAPCFSHYVVVWVAQR
jgi:hypothetical protein